MAFNRSIDINPDPYLDLDSHQQFAIVDAKRRKNWFFGTLLLVLLIGLLVVWLRVPIYQSTSVLKFTYTDSLSEEQTALATQDFAVSQHRLVDQGLLSSLQLRLLQANIVLPLAELTPMLSNDVEPEQRLLTLAVTGTDKDILAPILTIWLDEYLTRFAEQQQSDSQVHADLAEQKLNEINSRLAKQRQNLERFGLEHDIVSLEREDNLIASQLTELTKSINLLEQERAAAAGQVNAIEQAKIDGIALISPENRQRQGLLSTELSALEQELNALSQRFTKKYLQRDPDIMDKFDRADSIRKELAQLSSNQDQRYEQEIRQNLYEIEAKLAELLKKRDTITARTHRFNTLLAEYEALAADIEQLELEATNQKNNVLNVSVVKRVQPYIDVIKSPSQPVSPVAPHYWLDTLWVVLGAIGSAFLSLTIYRLVSIKPTNSAHTGTSYTVIQNPAQLPQAPQTEPGYLSHQQATRLLNQDVSFNATEAEVRELPRSLTKAECEALLTAALSNGRLAIMLILCGVSPAELGALTWRQFDRNSGTLLLTGRFKRSIALADAVIDYLNEWQEDDTNERSIWLQPDGSLLSLDDLNLLVKHAGDDAQLNTEFDITLNTLRHTYLLELVMQGVKLSQLEAIAGYVPAQQLTAYRDQTDNTLSIKAESITTIHSSLAKS